MSAIDLLRAATKLKLTHLTYIFDQQYLTAPPPEMRSPADFCIDKAAGELAFTLPIEHFDPEFPFPVTFRFVEARGTDAAGRTILYFHASERVDRVFFAHGRNLHVDTATGDLFVAVAAVDIFDPLYDGTDCSGAPLSQTVHVVTAAGSLPNELAVQAHLEGTIFTGAVFARAISFDAFAGEPPPARPEALQLARVTAASRYSCTAGRSTVSGYVRLSRPVVRTDVTAAAPAISIDVGALDPAGSPLPVRPAPLALGVGAESASFQVTIPPGLSGTLRIAAAGLGVRLTTEVTVERPPRFVCLRPPLYYLHRSLLGECLACRFFDIDPFGNPVIDRVGILQREIDGAVEALGELPAARVSVLRVNAFGDVAGTRWSDKGSPVAFFSRRGPGGLGLREIEGAALFGLNDRGDAAGFVMKGGVRRAFAVIKGAARTLGTLGGKTSLARAIGPNGEIVGRAATAKGVEHAFMLRGSELEDLGGLGGALSEAVAVNAAGMVAGWGKQKDGRRAAFLRYPEKDAKLIVPEPLAGYDECVAADLNDAGVIVGTCFRGKPEAGTISRGVRIVDGKVQALDELLEPEMQKRITIVAAQRIVASGAIVALADDGKRVAPVLLTPVDGHDP